jgi:hypothetical protein
MTKYYVLNIDVPSPRGHVATASKENTHTRERLEERSPEEYSHKDREWGGWDETDHE